MAYKALYRTYRPASFSEVVGQKHVILTLENAVRKNKLAHAYLFCGPRGTGKTSIAKILAKSVNCENTESAPCNECSNCLSNINGNHPDIVEIDAASNNGVDEIRNLIEKVKYAPIEGRYKVYIIDEVHMLSTGAFNALLKTLEEPPSHVIFVLATTEPHKILPTIISRCQRYDFTKVETEDMTSRIKTVLAQENIECEDEAIQLISSLADGGMRDALSILDQCIAYAQNNITTSHINEIYGILTVKEKLELLSLIHKKDVPNALSLIKQWFEKGIDLLTLCVDCIEICKESLIYVYTKSDSLLVKLSLEQAQTMSEFSESKLILMIDTLLEASEKLKHVSNAQSYFEITALKLMSDPVQQVITQEVVVPAQTKVNETQIKEITENEVVKEEIVSRETKKDYQDAVLDVETILQLMVIASKNEKIADIEKWKKIETLQRDPQYARFANLLREVSVAVSGEHFVMLETQYQALTNELSEMKEEIEAFLCYDIDIKKNLFITNKTNFFSAMEAYKERRAKNTLPAGLELKPKEIIIKEEVKEVDKNLENLKNLFGENVEIIEEN